MSFLAGTESFFSKRMHMLLKALEMSLYLSYPRLLYRIGQALQSSSRMPRTYTAIVSSGANPSMWAVKVLQSIFARLWSASSSPASSSLGYRTCLKLNTCRSSRLILSLSLSVGASTFIWNLFLSTTLYSNHSLTCSSSFAWASSLWNTSNAEQMLSLSSWEVWQIWQRPLRVRVTSVRDWSRQSFRMAMWSEESMEWVVIQVMIGRQYGAIIWGEGEGEERGLE